MLKSDPKRRGYITLEEHVRKGFRFSLTYPTTLGVGQPCSKKGKSCWEYVVYDFELKHLQFNLLRYEERQHINICQGFLSKAIT